MLAVNYSTLRENMKTYMDKVTDDLAGFWSRRINEKDRLIYKFDDANIYISLSKSL